jgi:hypothetical protein
VDEDEEVAFSDRRLDVQFDSVDVHAPMTGSRRGLFPAGGSRQKGSR